MQLRTAIFLWAVAIFGAACTSPDGEGPAEDCGAQSYQGLVGENLAAVSFADTISHRIIDPGTVVTTDFVPTRMNIKVGTEGVIEQIYCG